MQQDQEVYAKLAEHDTLIQTFHQALMQVIFSRLPV